MSEEGVTPEGDAWFRELQRAPERALEIFRATLQAYPVSSIRVTLDPENGDNLVITLSEAK